MRRALLAIGTVVALVALFGVQGQNVPIGYAPFNCPIHYSTLNLTVPVNALPCKADCQSNHGAGDGVCTGGDTPQCKCLYNYTTGENPTPILYSSQACTLQGCQCADQSQSGLYSAVCNADCACNHGANSGTCNYDAKACVCDYSTPYNNANCIVSNLNNVSYYSSDAQLAYQIFMGGIQARNLSQFFYNTITGAVCIPNPLGPGGILGNLGLG